MRAAAYIRIPTRKEANGSLDEYKEQVTNLCKRKGYDLLALIEVVGSSPKLEELGIEKIMELAKKKLVDVLILPNLYMISRSMPKAGAVLHELLEYGVETECMEFELLEYDVWQEYKDSVRKRKMKETENVKKGIVMPVFILNFGRSV